MGCPAGQEGAAVEILTAGRLRAGRPGPRPSEEVDMQTKEILRIKGNALFTVVPGEPLGEAIAAMVEQDIGSLVVMDHGRLLGMLTFREVLQAVHTGGDGAKAKPVSAFMVKDPLTVGPDME